MLRANERVGNVERTKGRESIAERVGERYIEREREEKRERK